MTTCRDVVELGLGAVASGIIGSLWLAVGRKIMASVERYHASR